MNLYQQLGIADVIIAAILMRATVICGKHWNRTSKYIIKPVHYGRSPSKKNEHSAIESNCWYNSYVHIGNICCSGFYQLRQLRLIRQNLTFKTAVTLVHAFVISRINYCNAVLSGIMMQQLDPEASQHRRSSATTNSKVRSHLCSNSWHSALAACVTPRIVQNLHLWLEQLTLCVTCDPPIFWRWMWKRNELRTGHQNFSLGHFWVNLVRFCCSSVSKSCRGHDKVMSRSCQGQVEVISRSFQIPFWLCFSLLVNRPFFSSQANDPTKRLSTQKSHLCSS